MTRCTAMGVVVETHQEACSRPTVAKTSENRDSQQDGRLGRFSDASEGVGKRGWAPGGSESSSVGNGADDRGTNESLKTWSGWMRTACAFANCLGSGAHNLGDDLVP